jgi:hypothetical protein
MITLATRVLTGALLALGVGFAAGNALAQQRGEVLQPDSMIALRPGDQGGGRTTGIDRTRIADIPIWKRITLGSHKGVHALRAALEAARIRVGDSADEILGRPAFPFSATRTSVDLVVLTAADLGFEKEASLGDIHRRAMQLGLELCPAEAGPQLRLVYLDQPIGEFLHIAMQPIATYHGERVDLTLGNGGTGLLLIGGESRPDLMLFAGNRFVFVRPQRIALPDRR